jgi:hypothetical protein
MGIDKYIRKSHFMLCYLLNASETQDFASLRFSGITAQICIVRAKSSASRPKSPDVKAFKFGFAAGSSGYQTKSSAHQAFWSTYETFISGFGAKSPETIVPGSFRGQKN